MAEEQSGYSRKVSINGITYRWDELSEEARKQYTSLEYTDREIDRLRQQLAIYQTARNAYAQALQQALGKENMQ